MLLKPLLVSPPLCPACVYVCHCLFTPLVFYARCSLARQWPLRMKCLTWQYVSKPLEWKKAWWQQKVVCLERKGSLEQRKNVNVKGVTGRVYRQLENKRRCMQHLRREVISVSLQQSLDEERARPQFNLATYLPEQWHYKWAYWVRLPWPLLLVRPSTTRHCRRSMRLMHQPHCCSPNWGTSSIQCILAPLPLHHCVWRRKVGRGTRLMMVLTEYLSSGWRVMRHLSNLNIFHWAVMALSPGSHECMCVCVCARLHVCASKRPIWMLIISVWVFCMRMHVLVKAWEYYDTNQPP